MKDNATKTRLSAAQIASFEENGFLAIDRLLADEDLRPLEEEYDGLLDRTLRRLHAAGKVPSTFEELAFGERFAKAIDILPDLHVYFNISLPLTNEGAYPDCYDMHKGPAVFELLRNPKILDVVEQFIGPEIASIPVQHMRMKPPDKTLATPNAIHSNVGSTVWHQDIAALLPEADDTEQLTVWVAVTEATERNGCLRSVPGSHRQGPAPHHSVPALTSERQIPPDFMAGREGVALPVKRGGIILFHKMNIHSALPNRSDALRWSADLRYHRSGQPSGRPAFPGFIARSRANPASELRDPGAWADLWKAARAKILGGQSHGRMFEDARWNDVAS